MAWRLFYNRPTTLMELPGTDWGSDPPPLTGNERERETSASALCDVPVHY